MHLLHEEMSNGKRVYSFSQGMHIVLDTECLLIAHRLPANHTVFPGFLLFPLLVSTDTTTAKDRSRFTTAMRSASDSSIFL